MDTRIYVAGLISTERPESLAWRQRVARNAGAWNHNQEMHDLSRNRIVVLDPLRGKEDLVHQTSDGGITSTLSTGKDIMRRDYRDVISSDVLLVHLDDFGSVRPMVGTPMELGWAWEHHKPVVAVASKDNYLFRNHPMVSEAVSHYFEAVDAAWDYILKYYLRP